MPGEQIIEFLSRSGLYDRILFKIGFQCAPVIKGIKASNLVVVQKGSWQQLKMLLWQNGVEILLLCQLEKRDALLLFRKELLEARVKDKAVQTFLVNYGYEDFSLSAVLKKLKERYYSYILKKADFPHEMGVFLGYPMWDVQGFIENEGQHCLHSGYWKVYANRDWAIRLFKVYDQVREEVLQNIVARGCLYG